MANRWPLGRVKSGVRASGSIGPTGRARSVSAIGADISPTAVTGIREKTGTGATDTSMARIGSGSSG